MPEVSQALQVGEHGIRTYPEWDAIRNLRTRLGADVRDLDLSTYPRKRVRTMGRVALLATYASDQAIADAGLDETILTSGRTGIAYGSTHGSTTELESFARRIFGDSDIKGLPGSAYLKFMSHTCVANLAQYYGIRGRVVSTCSACVSASQAIGAGYELIQNGLQDIVICGGAEEIHVSHAAVFDIVYAASARYNERPDDSPRPFDAARDGLVVAEGAGTVVLESLESARRRGARIHAEILGYATNCDGAHVTAPSSSGMEAVMRDALKNARLAPGDVDYVNAHATGTTLGDVAESVATARVLGRDTAISSTKGHTGHTLGACGSIEIAFAVAMMEEGFLPPTRNLTEPDPECADLDYVMGAPRKATPRTVMSNNFAFGGINTSLIVGRR
jgi:3-oxoacyl-[acyl-carrier-protein] synthase II